MFLNIKLESFGLWQPGARQILQLMLARISHGPSNAQFDYPFFTCIWPHSEHIFERLNVVYVSVWVTEYLATQEDPSSISLRTRVVSYRSSLFAKPSEKM